MKSIFKSFHRNFSNERKQWKTYTKLKTQVNKKKISTLRESLIENWTLNGILVDLIEINASEHSLATEKGNNWITPGETMIFRYFRVTSSCFFACCIHKMQPQNATNKLNIYSVDNNKNTTQQMCVCVCFLCDFHLHFDVSRTISAPSLYVVIVCSHTIMLRK